MNSTRLLVSIYLCLLVCIPVLRGQDRSSELRVQEEPTDEERVERLQETSQTRHGLLLRMRESKRQAIRPPEFPFWKRLALRMDQKERESFAGWNLAGFHPRFDWIARGSGPALGIRYWKPRTIGKVDLLASGFYSIRSYQHFDFQMGILPNKGQKIPPRSFLEEDLDEMAEIDRSRFSRFQLYGGGRYRYYPRERFYGNGPDSRVEHRTTFLLKDTLMEMTAGYSFSPRIAWNFKVGALQHSLGLGREGGIPQVSQVFPTQRIFGQGSPPNYIRLKTSALFDLRNNSIRPTRGFFAAAGWEYFDEVSSYNHYNFHRLRLDLHGLLPLGYPGRLLFLRAAFAFSKADDENRVPFFLQPTLGGSDSLRGFDNYRFRGQDLMLYQLEYRWDVSSSLRMVLFGDTGTVSRGNERLAFSELKSDLGLGFRFRPSLRTLFKLDQAWSNEGSRTIVRFSIGF